MVYVKGFCFFAKLLPEKPDAIIIFWWPGCLSITGSSVGDIYELKQNSNNYGRKMCM